MDGTYPVARDRVASTISAAAQVPSGDDIAVQGDAARYYTQEYQVVNPEETCEPYVHIESPLHAWAAVTVGSGTQSRCRTCANSWHSKLCAPPPMPAPYSTPHTACTAGASLVSQI